MWRSAVQVCLGLRNPDVWKYGGLAQLARAPALQAGGQRFESVILHLYGPRGGAQTPKRQESETIFDILVHETVSKTLKATERDLEYS